MSVLNIVIPMAGNGTRFSNAGYKVPKPLLPLGDKPMIEWVIENVRPSTEHRFIFICRKEHLEEFPNVRQELIRLCPGCEIIEISEVTEGAACTVLLARDYINNDDPLMIANSDQYVDLDIDEYLTAMQTEAADGFIMTFWADDPKWSYCRLDENGTVTEVVEKQVVSNEATVGIYNFRRGRDFVWAADTMIQQDKRVNNEFYVAPAYNELIGIGQKVGIAATGRELDGMYGLGTPDDYLQFQTTDTFKNNC